MKAYKDLRIVFMGTPEFAVASLDALVKAGCTIVGVITAPDKPAGRGMQLQQSAVKKYAADNNLHVLQPEKLKNPEFLNELKSIAGRSANSSSLSYAARSSLEYAAHGLSEFTWQFITTVPRRCTN